MNLEPQEINTQELCERIKYYKCFGLAQAVKKRCGEILVLDTYYLNHKHKLDQLELKISLYNNKSIEKASHLIKRAHKISVIGL